jgi:hypothetical protein
MPDEGQVIPTDWSAVPQATIRSTDGYLVAPAILAAEQSAKDVVEFKTRLDRNPTVPMAQALFLRRGSTR